MSSLTSVILRYLFHGDFITFKALFHVEVLLSSHAYYLFFLHLFAGCSMIIFFLFFQTKKDRTAKEKVMDV